MARKVALYLDTSIPNALFREPLERREFTSLFFQEIVPKSEVFISELVLDEIEATPEPKLRTLLLKSIEGFSVLPVSPEAEKLSPEYLKHLRIPEPDALHIAIATIEGIDYLATWNMEHIARERTRRIVDYINFIHYLHRLFIVTPKDLLEEG